MTAIAQWGKSDWELACKLPGVSVARLLELEAARADAEAIEADKAEADDAAADDEEAMDDVTASAYVVSAKCLSIRKKCRQRHHLRTALNVDKGISVPSNVASERVITQ
jgi:hypothetical protein